MTKNLARTDSRIIGTLLLLLSLMAALPACNTVEGAGEDIGAAGDAISDSARDTKEEITE
jgi:predicted small secreted protein